MEKNLTGIVGVVVGGGWGLVGSGQLLYDTRRSFVLIIRGLPFFQLRFQFCFHVSPFFAAPLLNLQ